MSDDKCQRTILKEMIPDGYQTWHWVNIINDICGKPKDPEKLYCTDCEREVYDAQHNLS